MYEFWFVFPIKTQNHRHSHSFRSFGAPKPLTGSDIPAYSQAATYLLASKRIVVVGSSDCVPLLRHTLWMLCCGWLHSGSEIYGGLCRRSWLCLLWSLEPPKFWCATTNWLAAASRLDQHAKWCHLDSYNGNAEWNALIDFAGGHQPRECGCLWRRGNVWIGTTFLLPTEFRDIAGIFLHITGWRSFLAKHYED